MTLLSPLALLFGLFALVPLVLHLYQRRRRNVILFSTNRFFTTSVIRTQRSLRLRHLLLLLLRIAACVLLALALSRPILNWAGFFVETGKRDVVIVLDDSLSMQALDRGSSEAVLAGGLSRFERARQASLDLLSQLHAGDRAAVITFTGRTLGHTTRSGAALSGNIGGLLDDLRTLAPSAAAGDAHQALARAGELFQRAEQRTRRVILLSDLQQSDWRLGDWPAPPLPTELMLVQLAGPTRNNLILDEAVLSQTAAIAGQPNLLRVKMTNLHPGKAAADLVISLNGEPISRRAVELLGESPTVEQVAFTLDKPGDHQLTVTLDADDDLTLDNAWHMAVYVHPRLPILLVSGSSSDPSQRERHGAFFLRMAMAAISGEGERIDIDLVRPEDLPRVTLENFRVIVLSDVSTLPLSQVERLEKFVQAGGGMAIFLGDQMDPAFYNDLLGGASRPLGGLSPASVRHVVKAPDADTAMHLVESQLDHPMLQRFKGALRGALGGVDVYRAYDLDPHRGWVLASLNNRLPLLVERSYGQGRVIMMAAAPQPDWTNLPVRGVFVPLMTRLISYLADAGPTDASDEVGTELVLLRGGWDYEKPLRVAVPDGTAVTAAVKVQGADPVAYLPSNVVAQPGYYRLIEVDATQGRTLRAVNTPRSESLPETYDPADLIAHAGAWRVRSLDIDQVAAQTASLLSGEQASRELWSGLLWAVLVLVMIEPLLADWMGGRRQS